VEKVRSGTEAAVAVAVAGTNQGSRVEDNGFEGF
jgi:hypothetical protein